MKKIFFLFLTVGTLMSCLSNDNELNYEYVLLPVDSFTVPDEFNFGTKETVKLKFLLPDGCHSYHSVYYEYDNESRIIAIRAIKDLDEECTEPIIEKEIELPINIQQREDYILKFWKGKNDDNEDVFEEVTVPVII